MIVVTRLNGGQIGVNPDLIQRIDSAPDTILTLIDGTKYIVTESLAEVIELVNEHRATILARAREIQAEHHPHIGLVPDLGDEDDEPAQAPIAPAVPLRPRSV